MKLLKAFISFTTAAAMFNSPFLTSQAVSSLAFTDSDIAIGESNTVRGDMNGDGKLDIFDLPIMRHSQTSSQSHTSAAITNILTGQWKTEGSIGVRDFTFNNGTGTFIMEDTGFQQDFTYTVQGVNFIMNVPYTLPLTAVMTWTDSAHFSLKWNDGTFEQFTLVSDNYSAKQQTANTQQNHVISNGE